MKFKERPRVVDAVQWTGDNIDECIDFCPYIYDYNGTLYMQGESVNLTDWIVKDMAEQYRISPDILFTIYFEPVPKSFQFQNF